MREGRDGRRIYRPNVQIYELPDAIELVAEVPGADEKTTEITLDNDELTLRARVPADNHEGAKLVYAEFRDGDYERTFRLSEDIDRQRIEARVKDGVLRVRLPKAEHAQSRKIAVVAG
ncbi:MAG: heat-shock protein [Planctomycetaceae bacterium]|nr:MAG: heat-shock protein [Planctomycetaceae bacterium]